MKISKRLPILVAAAVLLGGMSVPARAQPQSDASAIAIGEKDIGGAVSSPHGREGVSGSSSRPPSCRHGSGASS
jgi:hypothetical protein